MPHASVDKMILIGASTGGPGHLRKIMTAIEGGTRAAIVIAQHMEAGYLSSFAKQIDELSALNVHLVQGNALIHPGEVYICSASSVLEASEEGLKIREIEGHDSLYNPDIDCLFESAAALAHRTEVLGIILTGIGEDGALGCRKLAESGAACIAESEMSAVVYGMPKRAYELNPAIGVQDLATIIATIKRFGV